MSHDWGVMTVLEVEILEDKKYVCFVHYSVFYCSCRRLGGGESKHLIIFIPKIEEDSLVDEHTAELSNCIETT